jgi:hypothetical protein
MARSSPPPPTAAAHPNQGFLARAHRIILVVGLIYALLVVLLAIPYFQQQCVYCLLPYVGYLTLACQCPLHERGQVASLRPL